MSAGFYRTLRAEQPMCDTTQSVLAYASRRLSGHGNSDTSKISRSHAHGGDQVLRLVILNRNENRGQFRFDNVEAFVLADEALSSP